MTWCTAFAMHFVLQTGRWHFAHCFSSEVLRLHPQEYDISTRELCIMVLVLDGSSEYGVKKGKYNLSFSLFYKFRILRCCRCKKMP